MTLPRPILLALLLPLSVRGASWLGGDAVQPVNPPPYVLARAALAPAVRRMAFKWQNTETAPGVYNWSAELDPWVLSNAAPGRVLIVMWTGKSGYTNDVPTFYSTNQYVTAKAALVNAAAARYPGIWWEPENEPDIGLPHLADHVAILQGCQPARKFGKLVGGVLNGPMLWPFQQLASMGMGSLVDAWCFHVYDNFFFEPTGFGGAHPDTWGAPWPGRLQQLCALFPGVPLIVDECGIFPPAARTTRVLTMLRAYGAAVVKPQCWYNGGTLLPDSWVPSTNAAAEWCVANWDDSTVATNNPTGNPAPHTQACLNLATAIGDLPCTGKSEDTNANVFAYTFASPSNAVVVSWAGAGPVTFTALSAPASPSVPCPPSLSIIVTNLTVNNSTTIIYTNPPAAKISGTGTMNTRSGAIIWKQQ